jgi:hypothetical protein
VCHISSDLIVSAPVGDAVSSPSSQLDGSALYTARGSAGGMGDIGPIGLLRQPSAPSSPADAAAQGGLTGQAPAGVCAHRCSDSSLHAHNISAFSPALQWKEALKYLYIERWLGTPTGSVPPFVRATMNATRLSPTQRLTIPCHPTHALVCSVASQYEVHQACQLGVAKRVQASASSNGDSKTSLRNRPQWHLSLPIEHVRTTLDGHLVPESSLAGETLPGERVRVPCWQGQQQSHPAHSRAF